MRLNELNDIIKNLNKNFFLVDYPFQREVKSVTVRDYDESTLYIDIETVFSSGHETLFLECNKRNLECWERYGLKCYHHTGIVEDAYKCAKKLEKYLRGLNVTAVGEIKDSRI